MEISALSTSFVPVSKEIQEKQPLTVFAGYGPEDLLPVRTPKSHKNHRHIPGFFWLSKLNRSVLYESRLELVVLKQLDFDPLLIDILPQPVVLNFVAEGKRQRHIPDFLVWRKGKPPLLVDVKPRKHINKERNQTAFAACQFACDQIHWDYTIECEPQRDFLINLNWLAGYRREPPNFNRFARDLSERALRPTTIKDLLHGLGHEQLVRPTLFHLMWRQLITFNMNVVLTDSTVVCLSI